jgi:hypothetical protein
LARIDVVAGSHVIDAPLNLADDAVFDIRAGSRLLVRALNADAKTLTKEGTGTLNVNPLHAAGLSINGGTVAIMPNGTAGTTSVLGMLAIAGGSTPTAKFNLGNNAVSIDYTATSPAETARQQIIAGRGGSGLDKTWNGPGITSSAAAATNATEPESRSVGYAENAALPLGPYATFHGQPVDNTSLLIAFTRTGDANLDGLVNDDDVTIVGASYAPGVPQPSWALGDFDYNGFVDDDDVTLLGAFYDPSAAPLATPESEAINNVTAVPEPQTSMLFVSGLFALTLFAVRQCLLSRSERAT